MWVLAKAWFSMGRMDAALLKKIIFFKAATNNGRNHRIDE
jgi:hypothetical protein